MTALLVWLGNLLGGPFAKAAVDAYKAKLTNRNNEDQRSADLLARELAIEQREAEVNADVIKAEQGNWLARLVRPLFALPFVIYASKVIVWDKVLGTWTQARTDDLSPEMWQWGGIILTAYFGGRSLEKVAAIIRGR